VLSNYPRLTKYVGTSVQPLTVADPGHAFWEGHGGGAKVQKVSKLAKYSGKQRETSAIGGGQMPPLPSPWIRHCLWRL